MKILKNIKLLFLTIIICWISSCTSMDDYKKYMDGGEIRYVAKIRAVSAHPGKNRINLVLKLGSDPSVYKVKAYWNDRSDSLEIATPNPIEVSEVNMLINNIAEGSYNFELITFDIQGNSSISVFAPGVVYGSLYEDSLLNRVLSSSACNVIDWGVATSGMAQVELIYTNNENVLDTLIVQTTDMHTPLADALEGKEFKYRTSYTPDPLAIDIFQSKFKTVNFTDSKLTSGSYKVVLTEVEWPSVATGGTLDVTQLNDTQFSFLIASAPNNNVPIIVDVDFNTNKTSVVKQQFGDFGPPYYMTAESVDSPDNYIDPCSGIISIRVYITNLDRGPYWGERTVTLQKE